MAFSIVPIQYFQLGETLSKVHARFSILGLRTYFYELKESQAGIKKYLQIAGLLTLKKASQELPLGLILS